MSVPLRASSAQARELAAAGARAAAAEMAETHAVPELPGMWEKPIEAVRGHSICHDSLL